MKLTGKTLLEKLNPQGDLGGRAFQAQRTVSAKALGQDRAGQVGERRAGWQEQREQGRIRSERKAKARPLGSYGHETLSP